MISPLLRWMEAPSNEKGFHFAGDSGAWSLVTYEEMAGRVLGATARLIDCGVRPNDRVALALPTGPDFVSAFYGAVAAGATPSVLTPPTILNSRGRFVEHTFAVLRVLGPAVIVTDDEHAPLLDEAARGLSDRPTIVSVPLGTSTTADLQPAADLALLQFTSGSTGSPRGVRVTAPNLQSNIQMIGQWLGAGPDDGWATWLPMYHDMGLVGSFLTSGSYEMSIWFMRPDQFVRSPVLWLECFGRHGATIGASPSFGFKYILRRVAPRDLKGLDFRRWRCAISGADRVDAASLKAFAERLGGFGFQPSALSPAYGLAEATLAVTACDVASPVQCADLDWGSLVFGREVPIERLVRLDHAHETDLVSCLAASGRPMRGVSVHVVDEAGQRLPERHLGELVVAGPSVAAGYEGPAGEQQDFSASGFRTGDAGFLLGADVFVLGRLGDSFKVRARSVFVEDLEALLSGVDGLRPGRYAVVAAPTREPGIAVLAEGTAGEWTQRAAGVLRRELGPAVDIKVLIGERFIRKTSSGKLRRRLMCSELVEGTLPVDVVLHWPATRE